MVVAALVLALVAAGCFLALAFSLASSEATRREDAGRAAPVVPPGPELFVPRQRTVRVESVVVTRAERGDEWTRWGRTGDRPRRALPPAPVRDADRVR